MNWLVWFVPACLHCRHFQPYLPSRKYDDLGKCTKHKNQTLYADQMRADSTKCGLQGAWYDPK